MIALGLQKNSFEKGATPTAAGTGTTTLGQLGCSAGLLDSRKINQLSAGDVKAQADFIIGGHSDYIVFQRSQGIGDSNGQFDYNTTALTQAKQTSRR